MLATKKLVSFGLRHSSTWQIFGSAMLERKAVIVKKFSPLEKAYSDLLTQIEVENSLLSDFELQARQEKLSRMKKKEGTGDTKIKYTEDYLAEWQRAAAEFLEKLNYTPVTDNKSLERCLDEPITLLVKQKLGDRSLWMFPQSAHKGEESIRETAERAVSEMVGEKLDFVALGNAPCAFYHYKYPPGVQTSTGFQGAKVFYFKIQYKKGDVDLNKKIGEDHMWANFEELMGKLPEPVMEAVRPSIFVAPSVDFTPFFDQIKDREEVERVISAAKSQ